MCKFIYFIRCEILLLIISILFVGKEYVIVVFFENFLVNFLIFFIVFVDEKGNVVIIIVVNFLSVILNL